MLKRRTSVSSGFRLSMAYMISFRLRTLLPISRAVSRNPQQWSLKCARGEFWGAIKHKIQQWSVTCPRLFVWLRFDKTFVSSPTEAKQNWTFAPLQRKNKRQSAVSLLQFSYNLVFSTSRDRKQMNSVHFPRQTQPREHSNATTKAYALPRD